MSVYKIFPSQDATIYSSNPTYNAGRDEVLEISSINNNEFIGTTVTGDDIRRALIQFSNTDLTTLNTLKTGYSYEVWLRMFLANASALPQDYSIVCNPISQSWVMGTGKFADAPNGEFKTNYFSGSAPNNKFMNIGDSFYHSTTKKTLYYAGGNVWVDAMGTVVTP